MNEELRKRMITVCSNKIEAKGAEVGLSFYAFFKNENSEPALLMELAQWWIMTHKLNHFEKATKIRRMVKAI